MDDENRLKQTKKNYFIAAAVLCVVGLLIMMFRETVVGLLAGAIPGIVLCVIGLIEIIVYIKTKLNVTDIIIGVLAIVAGIVLLCNRLLIVKVLAILIGLYLIVEGVMKIKTALMARKGGIGNWFILLIVAIIGIGLGIFLLLKPFILGNGFIFMIGLMLFIGGLLNLLHGVYTAKILQEEKQNIIDMDDYGKKN